MMRKARWTNGKKSVTGCWEYYWPGDKFIIELDSKDRITGMPRRMTIYDDTPEWGNWKLDREYKCESSTGT